MRLRYGQCIGFLPFTGELVVYLFPLEQLVEELSQPWPKAQAVVREHVEHLSDPFRLVLETEKIGQ